MTVHSKDNIVFTLARGMEVKAEGRKELRRFTFGWDAYFVVDYGALYATIS